MRVLHSGTLDAKAGGPALSTSLTMQGLGLCGVLAEIVMPPLNAEGELITDSIPTHYTEKVRQERIGYIPKLKGTLASLGTYDLYHVQGLWQYLGHTTAKFARNNGRPYIITPRGMLYPQALEHSKWVKKISLALYQGRDLQDAACVQTTCIEEMQHYRELGFTNPVAAIPNPIDVTARLNEHCSINTDSFRLGYLGRVHTRKRIERLIYAFEALRERSGDMELIIIGSGDREYETFLREEVKRLSLHNVSFTGFLTGEEKDNMVASLSVLAVPSDFENFGNIVTEALVKGVPVIASRGTPWQELEEYNCGWWINNDQETINKTIKEALSMTAEERCKMGRNGRKLMEEKYSVEVVGQKMKQLYEWVLHGGDKPEFLYL